VKLRRRCQGNHVAMARTSEPAAWAAGAWSPGGVVWCVYIIVLYLDYPQCYPVSATERYIFSTGSKKIGCSYR
jgi:hypothetical protein